MAVPTENSVCHILQGLTDIAIPAQLHDLVEHFVGPMILRRDGTIVPTKTAPADAEADVPSNIAGDSDPRPPGYEA